MSSNRRWLAVIAVFATVFALMIIPAIASDPNSIHLGTVLFMVIVSAGLASYVAFISAPNAGPDWLWAGRRLDPVRGIFFRRDGSWRRFGRLAAIVAPVLIFAVGHVLYAG